MNYIWNQQATVVLLALVIWHYGTKLLLRLLLGLRYSYINPFTLKIRNAELWLAGQTVSAKKLQLQINLFSRSKKLITLRATEVSIQLVKARTGGETLPKDSQRDKNVDIEAFLKDLDFEYDKPLKIFPDHAKLRFLTTLMTRYLPSTEIIVQDVTIGFKECEDIAFYIGSVGFVTDAVTESDKRSVSVFSGMIKGAQTKFLFSYATIKSVTFTDGIRHFPLVDMLSLNLGIVIDLGESSVYSLRSTLKATGVNMPVFPLMWVQKTLSSRTKPDGVPGNDETKEISQKDALKFLYVANSCLKMLEEVDVSIDRVSVDHIPILSSSEITNALSSKQLYSNVDTIFASVGLKSFSLNFSKLRFNNAGFDLHFDKLDKPVQLLVSLSSARVLLDLSHCSKATKGQPCTVETFTVPSMNCSINSNVLFQGLKALSNGKSSRAILSVDCTLWNPIMDISAVHLGLLISKFKEISYLNDMEQSPIPSKSRGEHGVKLETLMLAYSRLFTLAPPSFAIRFSVEKPTFILKHVDETSNSIYMLVIRPSMLGAVVHSSTERDEDDSYGLEVRCIASQLDVTFSKKRYDWVQESAGLPEKAAVKKIASFRDVKFNGQCDIKPELECSLRGDFERFFVDLSELETLDGIAKILDSVSSNIDSPRSGLKKHSRSINFDQIKEMLFRDLPKWVKKFELHGREFEAKLGSRSVLLPASLVTQVNIPGGGDRVGGSFRKVHGNVGSWDVVLKGTPSDPSTADSDSLTSSADSSQHDSFLDFWRFNVGIHNVVADTMIERAPKDDQTLDEMKLKKKVFLRFPELLLVVRGALDLTTKRNEILVDIVSTNLVLDYSLATHFIIMSSIHLLKNTIIKTKGSNESKNMHSTAKNDIMLNLKQAWSMIRARFSNNQTFITLGLPGDFSMKLDFASSDLVMEPDSPVVFTNQSARMHVQSPTMQGYWSRFLTFQSNELLFHLDKLIKGEINFQGEMVNNVVELMNSGSVMTIPNEFVIHKLFDSLGTSVKVLKQIHYSLKTNSNESCMSAKVMKPIALPRMRLKTRRFAFGMVDDPFEVELGMIYQLGLLEQRDRLAKIAEFNEKVKELMKEDTPSPLFESLTRLDERVATDTIAHVKRKSSRKDLISPLSRHDRPHTSATFPRSPRVRSQSRGGAQRLIDELDHKMYVLRKNFQKSWLRLVQDFRIKRELYARENGKTLWNLVHDHTASPEFNSHVLAMPDNPHLLSVIIEGAEMIIKQPTFPLEKLPDFIYEEGKGVPRETEYSLLLPVSLEAKAREVRAHIRDYPLPLLYMPPPSQPKEPAILLRGNFVVTEQFYDDPSNVRHVHVPLVPGSPHGSKFFSLDVPRTVASVKIIANASVDVLTDQPTTFTWGVSYTPAIQQMMMNFDAFSKPQLDPSEKIGVWDKVRSIMHGHAVLRWTNENEVRVNLKGSSDPYEVLGGAAGFVLSFRKKVSIEVNKTGHSRDFLVVDAKEVLWAIPNLVSQALPVWSNRSSKSVFLPNSDTFFASSYGYFLDDTQNQSYPENARDVMKNDYYAKVNLKLYGQIRFKLGFLFERKSPDGGRSSDFIPHYKVKLTNAEYVKGLDHYDAYDGFRSEYIHMAFSLIAPRSVKGEDDTTESSNSIHLSPNTFNAFFSWWNMFGGDVGLPIRNGTLFGPKEATKKFGAHLFTIKFQFLLEPLFLFHGYRGDLSEPATEGIVDMVGLKAKIDSFSVDLHQRKEVMVKRNNELNTSQQIMKMKMYLGEILLTDVDIRAVEALFKLDLDTSGHGEHVLRVFDDDESWFDIQDTEEEGLTSVKGMTSSARILPFLFAPMISYKRDTDHGKTGNESDPQFKPFGDEPSHDCTLGKNSHDRPHDETWVSSDPVIVKNIEEEEENLISRMNHKLENADQLYNEVVSDASSTVEQKASEAVFNNVFALNHILLKWNCNVRNLVFKYFHNQGVRRAYRKYGKYQVFKVAEEAIDATLRSSAGTETEESDDSFKYTVDETTCTERVANFEEDLRKFAEGFGFTPKNDYSISLVEPQIQLFTTEDSDSCALVTSPRIDLNIVSIIKQLKDTEGKIVETVEDETIQTRFGSFLKDANVFVLYKDDVEMISSYSLPSYGSKSNWPPWLSHEVPPDFLESHMLLEKTSMVIRYDKVDVLGLSSRIGEKDRIIVDVPKVAASCDSKQYFAFFVLVVDLLIYSEPSSQRLNEQLQKLLLSTDLSDLEGVRTQIRKLQNEFAALRVISKNFDYRRSILSEEEFDLATEIRKRKAVVSRELFLLVNLVTTGASKESGVEWTIRADEIGVSMLESNRKAFIDLSVKKGTFRRIEQSGGFNTNVIEVGIINASNKYDQALFPELLSGFDDKSEDTPQGKNQIELSWAMESAVGGIKIIKDFDIKLQPLKLQLDEATGNNIMNYVFPYDPDFGTVNPAAYAQNDIKDKYQEEELHNDLEKAMSRRNSDVSSERLVMESSIKNSLDGVIDEEEDVESTNQVESSDSSDSDDDENMTQMVNRASSYFSLVSVCVHSVTLCISFRGSGLKRLINVFEFVLRVPTFAFENKLWGTIDLVNHLKKVVIKALLAHSSSLLGNKLKIHSRRRRLMKQLNLKRLQKDINK
ncbi:unnamed protein product [Kuraishia capsulata CBS 1993]|uniref:FMP27 GFWDK domain-containing protein n=1 Tax=Kuraishia capsulata CBS 1993 TaxID=1382522 RepID=W6MNT1_9ASCO|nr:uncharacterized protein KUCA_T00002691001 [Kuraishia capsulata CBS 1993]CDK26717.1 unnamed protein product [Kuraishia capsulata CBS 1993]